MKLFKKEKSKYSDKKYENLVFDLSLHKTKMDRDILTNFINIKDDELEIYININRITSFTIDKERNIFYIMLEKDVLFNIDTIKFTNVTDEFLDFIAMVRVINCNFSK